ncbi:hypothetical protein [Pantoea agglomerans]|jgi:hypothetical protein|nr:hypothetical protein [Pantoea agglomerans]
MIVPEIATAYLTSFSASIHSALWICRKIAGTTSVLRHNASGLS